MTVIKEENVGVEKNGGEKKRKKGEKNSRISR